MIYPNFIKEGSTIGVGAPSSGIVEELKVNRLNRAIKNLEDKCFLIQETKDVRTDYKGCSAKSEVRAEELASLFLNKNIQMIICAAGGEFLLTMLSFFDFSVVKNNPKWIQGYSDATGLLYVITTNLDIATIYASNFGEFGMVPWHESLDNNLEILKGNLVLQESFLKYEEYEESKTEFFSYNLVHDVKWEVINGKKALIKGRLIGGCIDVLRELFGTRFDKTKEFLEKYKDDGIVWYFDNCELSSEDLIRVLWKFKDNGYFKYTKGIIFGRSGTYKSNLGISFYEAINGSLKDLGVPIVVDADLGHVAPRMTLINGAIVEISVEDKKGKVKFSLE